jgi:hypothetical protein
MRALAHLHVDLVTRMAHCHAPPPLAVRRVHAAGDQARRGSLVVVVDVGVRRAVEAVRERRRVAPVALTSRSDT